MLSKFKFLPAVSWMVIIFVISSLPDLPSNNLDLVDFFLKKSAHFLEYAILFVLWYYALGQKSPLKAIIFSLAYAFSDEIHQLFVPGRSGKLTDVAIDFAGILVSYILIVKFELWKKLLSPLLTKRLGR